MDLFLSKDKNFFREEGLEPQARLLRWVSRPMKRSKSILPWTRKSLKPQAVSPSQIFDFSLQRKVNRKLGIK
jgi:hypothetical protein